MLLDREDLDQPVRRTPPDLRYGHTAYCSVAYPRIRRIHMFLGRLDPDPLVRCSNPAQDPDPSIIRQK
jgi:hypothetical protein